METRVKRSGADCGEIWVDGDLVFGAIAAAGAAFAWIVYQHLSGERRRKKRKRSSIQNSWSLNVLLGTKTNS